MGMTRRAAFDRFAEKVVITDDCWNWTGRLNPGGYGQFRTDPRKRSCHAHRAAYELLVEPIPEGLTIDHLCRNTACVNPDHLEPVTARENVLRALRAKTTCKYGHPLDGRTPKQRYCKTCHCEHQRRYLARKELA